MAEQPPSEASDGAVTPAAPDDASRATVGDVLRWLAVAACAGAAVIHFAYAPAHLDEDPAHGTFFLITGWLQLGLAFSLARWRTDRWPWLAAGAVNAVVAAVWVLTRTAGLPGEDPESVGFPDTLATVLEIVVVVAAVAALRPRSLDARPSAPTPSSAVWRPWRWRSWCRPRSRRRSPASTTTARARATSTASRARRPRGPATTTVPGRPPPRWTPTTAATSASTPRPTTRSACPACRTPTTTAPRSTSRWPSGRTCSSTPTTASRPTWSRPTSRTARCSATASCPAASPTRSSPTPGTRSPTPTSARPSPTS